MNAYYDTGTLVPLYAEEVLSATVTAFVARRGEPVPLNLFQRLELENAMRQKVFRGEIEAERLNRVLVDLREDLDRGRLVLRAANWIAALEEARSIGARATVKTGCRTLDLIHVAIAVQWGCSVFVTADDRQLAAAKREGLCTMGLRDLHRRGGDARAEPGGVREPRLRYGSRKRPRGG